jgi:AcrR family transcriptional regulator
MKAAPRRSAGRPWNEAIPDREESRRLKRAAILDGAARLFVERGYHETTLEDIATGLSVTKPTLYYYVRSKEDILVQILAEALESTIGIAQNARRNATTGRGRLHEFVRHYVEGMTQPYGRCLLTMRSTPLAPATRTRLDGGFRRMDALAREFIEEGIADGSIVRCDVRMATFALFGAINTVPFWYRDGGSLSPSQAADALFAIVERGLAAAPSTPPPATPSARSSKPKASTT